MAVDDQGDFGYGPLSNAMYATLVEMVDSGFISAQELQRMSIPTVGRSRADFLAPFGVDGRFSGFRVQEIEIFFAEDRIWSDFEQHRDAQEFGARWAAFSRVSDIRPQPGRWPHHHASCGIYRTHGNRHGNTAGSRARAHADSLGKSAPCQGGVMAGATITVGEDRASPHSNALALVRGQLHGRLERGRSRECRSPKAGWSIAARRPLRGR